MLFLTAEDVRRAAPLNAAIDAVANAFVQLSTGQANVPLRVPISQPDRAAHTFFMPAHLLGSNALGMKIVSVFPHNTIDHGVPNIHALVVVLDAATGRPLATLDGTYLTALRTGAVSGAATRILARPNAQVLAIFGAGAQAPLQIAAVCATRPIERIWIVNRTRAHAEALARRLQDTGMAAEVCIALTSAAALAEADIVCCATSAATPLFCDEELRAGTHINGVGSFTPHMAEVPPQTVARARLVVDQRSAAWAEAGDLIQARDAGRLADGVGTELGEVLTGQVPGRTSAQEITFFKSVGNAVQDIAVAHLALAGARRLGLGIDVPL